MYDLERRTCEFCKYRNVSSEEYPCNRCCNNYLNKFEDEDGNCKPVHRRKRWRIWQREE